MAIRLKSWRRFVTLVVTIDRVVTFAVVTIPGGEVVVTRWRMACAVSRSVEAKTRTVSVPAGGA